MNTADVKVHMTDVMHVLEHLTVPSLCATGDGGASGNHCSENFPAAPEDR